MAWATVATGSSLQLCGCRRTAVRWWSTPGRTDWYGGYAGAIRISHSGGLALGSWLATLIAGVSMIVILLRRTLLEDKMLQEGLAGYKEHAARVKYRLAPGIW